MFPQEHSGIPEALPTSPLEHTENRNRGSSASLNGYPTAFNKHSNEMQRKGWERERVPQRKHPSTKHLLLFKSIDLQFFSSSFESEKEVRLEVSQGFL